MSIEVNEARASARVALYEGLVISTARLIEPWVELDQDDIEQRLRIKVWKGLLAYEPHRSRQTERRYVFCVVANEKKDILKRKRHGELFIEDMAPGKATGGGIPQGTDGERKTHNWFEGHYLSQSAEQAFHAVEMCDVSLPETLTAEEREIVLLLYAGRMQMEVAVELGLTPDQMRWAMVRLREKLEDYRPCAPDDEPEPATPLPPRAVPPASRADAPAAQAA